MPTITFTISLSDLNRISNAFASQFGYQDTIINDQGISVPNPQIKSDFAKTRIKEYIAGVVNNSEYIAAQKQIIIPAIDIN